MKREDGAIEFGAVIILLFLSSVIAGLAMVVNAGMTYFRVNSLEQNEKAGADKLLIEIVASFQPLGSYEYDYIDNLLIQNLRSKYAVYDLDVRDISSGYHLDFLSDKDLSDARLAKFLFAGGSASEFISYRNNHGLSTDKSIWRSFINDAAWEACTSYGWLHKTQMDTFAFGVISASHNASDPSSLFPLMNEMPMMNVNMVSPDIIIPLIMRPSFGIKKPEEKAVTFKNKLLAGPVLLSDISSYLEIPMDNPLFIYLGTKTAFWRIVFRYQPGMYVEAVIAAIPKKDGGIQEIENYKLIDRSIRYER